MRYGIDIPFWDEWSRIEVLRQVASGNSSLRSLVFYNAGEHHIGAEILSAAALWQITGMHERTIMVWNWSLALAFCMLCLSTTARELGWKSPIPWIALGASGFFVFNPAAFQVWLWALPLVYILVFLLLVIGIYIIQSELTAGTKLVFCGALATSASFLISNGLLLWALLPGLLLARQERKLIARSRISLALFFALLSGTALARLHLMLSYQSQAPSTGGIWGVYDIASFFLAYTGNLVSLSLSPQPLLLARGTGLLLIVIFIVAGGVELRLAVLRDRRRAVWIWIAIGAASLLSGVLVAVGRHSFGANYALEASRYVLASAFLPIAAVVLAAMAMADCLRGSRARLIGYSCLLSLGSVLAFISLTARVQQARASVPIMLHWYFERLHGKVAVAAVDSFRLPEYRNIFPSDNFDEFRRSVAFLNDRGWLHPPVWDENYIRRLPTTVPDPKSGVLETAVASSQGIELAGWAYLSKRNERPHAILVTGDAGTGPRILAVCFPNVSRSDVATAFGNVEAASTGWTTSIPNPASPTKEILIRSYAYDAVNGEAYLLRGATTVVPAAPKSRSKTMSAGTGAP